MPTLSIDIEARFAKFQDGLDKIDRDVSRATRNMSKSFGTLKTVAASLIGTFAGLAGIQVFKSLIDDLDKLHTVSGRTGVSAEKLVGLALAAKQTGTDFETAAKGLNKINIALSQLATGKSAELKDLLTQLGLPEFAKGAIDAEEAMLQLAGVFPRLSSADQARVALDLLGKSGQELIPLFEGGRKPLEAFFRVGKDNASGINDLAKAADEFNDAMTSLAFGLKASLLPVLQALLSAFKSLSESIFSAKQAGTGFYEILPFEKSRAQISLLRKDLDGLRKQQSEFEAGKATGKGFVGTLNKAFSGSIGDVSQIIPIKERQLAELERRVQQKESDEARDKQVKDSPLKLRAQEPKTKGGRTRAADRDDSAQRLLDQQIKAFERSIDQERDLAQTRNDFLQRFYDDGLISLGDYTKARVAIMEESANAQKVAIGSEIALLEASKKGKKADDRIAIDTKINDLLDKQATLNQDVKIAGANLYLDNIKAGKEYAEVLERINIRSLESKGDILGAARQQFSLDNREDLTKIDTGLKSASTSPEDKAALERAKAQIKAESDLNIEIARFNVLANETASIRNDAADAEERINIAVETGQISQIDGLQQISAIRTKLSADLLTQGELLENISLLTKDPAQIESVKALGIEIERLNAQLDPLREKMADLLSSGVSGFFQDIASGTKSAKQAFKSMVDDFTKRLTAFFSDQLFKQLFGEKGALGGVAGLLTGSIAPPQQQQQTQPQGGGFAGALASFFGLNSTQTAAPVSQGVASSLGSGSAGVGADAASALKDVATSSTATSFALQEFADQGVAGATESLFENVAASSIEQSAEQTATVSLTALSIATDQATAAMIKQATAAAVSGAVQSSAGGFAEGGQVSGPGTGTSDSIPVLLSNKEFVVRAKPVQEPGALAFLTRFNKMGMKAMARYSMGGLVGASMGTGWPRAMSSQALVAAGGVTLVQNFTVEPRTPKETQLQLASAAYQGGMRAYRRNR